MKYERAEAAEVPRSPELALLRRSGWPGAVGRVRQRFAEPVNHIGDGVFGTAAGHLRDAVRAHRGASG